MSKRLVVTNGRPEYFGGEIKHEALMPAGDAELGAVNFEKLWANQFQKAS